MSDAQNIYEFAEKLRAEKIATASQIISDRLEKATKFLGDVAENVDDIQPEFVPVYRLRLDAAKHIIKVGGMEVENQKIEQKTVVITVEQENKILNAAQL